MKSTSSSPEALISALWAVAEATWVCLAAQAAVNTSDDLRLPLSYTTFAVAGAGAALVAARARRARIGWCWRWLSLVAVALVGTSLAAGVLAAGASAALAPWDLFAHSPEGSIAPACLLAALMWLRGSWLGGFELTTAHAGRAACLGSAVFATFLLGRTADDPAFTHATRDAPWLFVIFVATTVVTIALVRQQELEQRLLRGRRSGLVGLKWLLTLGAPITIAVGLGFAAALVARPVGEPLAEKAREALGIVGSGYEASSKAVDGMFGGREGTPAPERIAAAPPSDGGSTPRWAGFPIAPVLFVALVLILIGGACCVLVPTGFAPLRRIPVGHRNSPGHELDEERYCAINFRRLLRGFFERLIGRMRRMRCRQVHTSVPSPATGSGPLPAQAVRREYVQLLSAARRRGFGRRQSETVEEFEGRLRPVLEESSSTALRTLTILYSAVRYGDLEGMPDDAKAQGLVQEVTADLGTDASSQPLPPVGV